MRQLSNEEIRKMKYLYTCERYSISKLRKVFKLQFGDIKKVLMYHNSGNMYLTRKRQKFEDFIKDRGSTTTIDNPIYSNAEYKELCYIED